MRSQPTTGSKGRQTRNRGSATRRDHAAYLASWLRVLRRDARALITVSNARRTAPELATKPPITDLSVLVIDDLTDEEYEALFDAVTS